MKSSYIYVRLSNLSPSGVDLQSSADFETHFGQPIDLPPNSKVAVQRVNYERSAVATPTITQQLFVVINDLNVKKLIAIYPEIASTIQSIQEETKKDNEFLEREPDPFYDEHPWFWRFEMLLSRENPTGFKPEVEYYWSWGPIGGTATFYVGEILKSQ